MSGKRFIIEGEWTGYRSSQRRVVHRTVHRASRDAALLDWVRKNHSILYTDGTSLILRVRECKPRERVEEKNAYGSLIRDCARRDVTTVRELQDIEDAEKTAREEATR